MLKNRLEAFSDNVMAFAITLLVLEIRIPDLGSASGNRAMFEALLSLAPNFAVYVISFAVCTVWWIAHHTLISDLHAVDRYLLWANSSFLMWIVFLPYPTGFLGHHLGQPIPTAFYGLACALAGFSFWLMRRHASLRDGLMKSEIGRAARLRRVRISMLSPALYLTGAILSLRHPIGGLCLYAAIPAFFAAIRLGHPNANGIPPAQT